MFEFDCIPIRLRVVSEKNDHSSFLQYILENGPQQSFLPLTEITGWHIWPHQLANKWEIILLLLRKLAVVEYKIMEKINAEFIIELNFAQNIT